MTYLAVHLHDECMNSAHPCFRCKMYIWRSEGRSPFTRMPEGWRGPSVRERARRQVADAKAAGIEIESAKGYYGGRA